MSGTTGSYSGCMFIILKTDKMFSKKWFHCSTFLPVVHEISSCFRSLSTLGVVSLFNVRHSNWCTMISHSEFNLEVINLQYNNILKGKYQGKNRINFCKCLLSDKYTELKSYKFELIAIFGSTYLCERHFQR